MDIIDEIADHDKRKRNIIVYNLPEPFGKSDSDAFAAHVPQCTVIHFQSQDRHVWERKLINIDHYCHPCLKKKTCLNFFPDLIYKVAVNLWAVLSLVTACLDAKLHKC